jgi:hypothetical protein
MKICGEKGYSFRAFPLISDTGLFGAVGVLYTGGAAPDDENWRVIEGCRR